jgi:hypothetical protein
MSSLADRAVGIADVTLQPHTIKVLNGALTAIKTNPEQSTRSGLLPQLGTLSGRRRSVGGYGDAARIEPIKSQVGSETSAHNAATCAG